MRISIIDACFSLQQQQARGLAALWLEWKIEKLGVEVTSPDNSDIIAITCVDPRQYKLCATVRKKYPMKKIIIGGAGALSPYTLGKYCDAVCVGNGDRFVDTLVLKGFDAVLDLNECWTKDGKKSVIPAKGFPWMTPPIQGEDGAFRVWCGIGCKNKCLFCQTGWAQEYEENPNPELLVKIIKKLRSNGKRVSYLSNDALQHTFCENLPIVESGSYSIKFMKKNGLPPSRQIRIGIEGVSERMRRYVGKPIGFDDLVKCSTWLNENGKSVRWFLIAGLPGETKEDWIELMESIQSWKKTCSHGVLALSFTAWQPETSTPLASMPLDDQYYEHWLSFREWFFGGSGWSNRVNLMPPAGPNARLESAVARTGLGKEDLYLGGVLGPNHRVIYPYHDIAMKKMYKLTGREPRLI